MNTTNPAPAAEIDATRGDLRRFQTSPRPIHHPETDANSQLGGRR